MFQNAFSSLGTSENVDDTVIQIIEKFVCVIYSKPKIESVNEARVELFTGKYKEAKRKSQPLYSTENMDWPPCSAVLYQKILRTNLIANIIHSAHTSSHFNYHPYLNGWNRQGDFYYPKWFNGDISSDLESFSVPYAEESESESECEYTGDCFSDSSDSEDEN